jgi:hypothetical protein
MMELYLHYPLRIHAIITESDNWTYQMTDTSLGTVLEIPGHLVTKDIRKCGGINERVVE